MAKDTKFNLTIKINGKEVANTLNGVGKEIGRLKKELRNLNEKDPKFKEKQKELAKARERYSEIKNEIDGTNNVLQEARGNWDNFVSGLLSGNMSQASQGLKGIAGNIKNITKAAWAFIATPIGAALAAIAAIGLGVKKWVNYNLEIEKTNQLIRDLTQEAGTAVDAIRVRAEVLQKTFDVDINKSVESAKSLVKGFGISYNEAFDIIENGAIRGKLKNDEYLDSLKEYPIQFKNAGFSAQDFANIVETGIDLSIYSDKLPDAIKEFNLSITEQTDAAKEALTNAFGEKFTSKLLKGLKNGSVTAKDALARISAEAERIGLNSQQAQLLTADLFKGAGEDAGGALKIFEAVNLALNEQKKPLTEIQKIQKEQLDANKELNSVYTQLFASGSKGFNLWIQKGKLFATQTLLKILKGGVDVYNWFVDLNNESGVFSSILKSLGIIATSSFEVIGILISGAWDSFKGLGNIVAGVFTLDWDRIKQGFNQGAESLGNVLDELKNKAIDDGNAIVDAWNGKNKMERLSLNDFLSDDTGKVTTTEDNPIDTKANARKQVFEKSEKELNDLIKKLNNEKLLNQKEGFDRELLAIDQKYNALKEKFVLSEDELKLLNIEKRKEYNDKLKEIDDSAEREKQVLKIDRDAEFTEELKAIEEENRLLDEEAKLELDVQKATTDKQRELAVIAKAQYIANKQLEIEKKKELDKVKAYKNAEQIKQGIRNKYDKLQAKLDSKFKKAKSQADEQALEDERVLNSKRLQAYADMFGGIAKLLGEHTAAGKAAAIAQATINTYQGITEVWRAKSVLPEPFATAAKVVSTATVLASGLGAVKKITSTKTPKFFVGGPTGDEAIYNDGYGKVVGVVHDNEWVAPKFMTESPRYAPTIQWLENERLKELGKGFFEGGKSSETSTPEFNDDTDISTEDNSMMFSMMQLLEKLDSKLDEGFKGYMVRDYEDFLLRKELDQEHKQIFDNTRA